jgi:hypothetical protein
MSDMRLDDSFSALGASCFLLQVLNCFFVANKKRKQVLLLLLLRF